MTSNFLTACDYDPQFSYILSQQHQATTPVSTKPHSRLPSCETARGKQQHQYQAAQPPEATTPVSSYTAARSNNTSIKLHSRPSETARGKQQHQHQATQPPRRTFTAFLHTAYLPAKRHEGSNNTSIKPLSLRSSSRLRGTKRLPRDSRRLWFEVRCYLYWWCHLSDRILTVTRCVVFCIAEWGTI